MERGRGETGDTGISPIRALAVALLAFVGIRLVSIQSVFRDGDILLLGNDPYAYLHVVTEVVSGEVALASQSGFGLGEPLLIATLSSVAWLAGGPPSVGAILAIYPVLAGAVVAVGTYVLATLLTDDARVGLAAVLILAVTPLNVSRTAFGFADHHAFDLLWVTVVATALTWLLVRTDASPRRRWIAGGVLGLGVGAQTMAWNASPLLLVPAGVALLVTSVVSRKTRLSWVAFGPILLGLGVGAVIAQILHQILGWQTEVVATSPVLLFLGALVLVGLDGVTEYFERSWPSLVVLDVAAGVLGVLLLWGLAPDVLLGVSGELDALAEYFGFHRTTTIGETNPITGEFGPILGFVVLLGFAPMLGFPVVAWAVWAGWTRGSPKWYVLVVFLVWLLGLSFVQRRFAVHMTPFLAVAAGIGFVTLADWLGLLRLPQPLKSESPSTSISSLHPPERERLAVLGAFGVVGMGTSGLLSTEIVSRLAIEPEAYRAARWIREDVERKDLTYPENYVLAEWGRVRMFNHVVNGHSRSYAYARRTYEDFLRSQDPDAWYDEFAGRVGFVVTRTLGDVSPVLAQGLLHSEYGSGQSVVEGVGHFRARWESESGAVKVFEIVPGATVTGTAPAGTELTFTTTVTLANTGASIQYRRSTRVAPEGTFAVTLAHPGTYQVGEIEITVPESAVQEDGTIEISVPQAASG